MRRMHPQGQMGRPSVSAKGALPSKESENEAAFLGGHFLFTTSFFNLDATSETRLAARFRFFNRSKGRGIEIA